MHCNTSRAPTPAVALSIALARTRFGSRLPSAACMR